MSCAYPLSDQAAYRTGRLLDTQEVLSHPGGSALTFHGMHLAGMQAGARILDLGCGSGASMQLLHSLGFEAIGVDPAAGEPEQGEGTRVRAYAEKLPLDDHSVDGILAECSFSVMEGQERVLDECARVLRLGGRLVLSDLYAREPQAIDQVRMLARSCISGMIVREELESMLCARGFTIDLWEDHSPALREFIARFLMRHDSLEALWCCDGSAASAQVIQSAMRAVRAGYFLLIASYKTLLNPQKGEGHE